MVSLGMISARVAPLVWPALLASAVSCGSPQQAPTGATAGSFTIEANQLYQAVKAVTPAEWQLAQERPLGAIYRSLLAKMPSTKEDLVLSGVVLPSSVDHFRALAPTIEQLDKQYPSLGAMLTASGLQVDLSAIKESDIVDSMPLVAELTDQAFSSQATSQTSLGLVTFCQFSRNFEGIMANGAGDFADKTSGAWSDLVVNRMTSPSMVDYAVGTPRYERSAGGVAVRSWIPVVANLKSVLNISFYASMTGVSGLAYILSHGSSQLAQCPKPAAPANPPPQSAPANAATPGHAAPSTVAAPSD